MHSKWFELAKKLSKCSSYPQHKHGAVIVRKNKVVSLGFNKASTHPKSNHKYKHIHAEVHAILMAKVPLEGCSLYVYRETKDGVPAMSKPCASCEEFIKLAGITKVYYSILGGFNV